MPQVIPFPRRRSGDVFTALYLFAGGLPLKDAASLVGYSPGHLRNVACSDEGKDFIESNREQARRELALRLYTASLLASSPLAEAVS